MRHSTPSASRSRLRAPAIVGALLAVLSCGGEDTTALPPPPPTTPTALVPARVTLEPAEVTVAAGDTLRVKAIVFNDRAQPISDAAVSWTSSDPAIATIDATGLVTGLKEGDSNLTATSGPASATAPVAVHSPDRATLMDLYNSTGGDWINDTNWGSTEPLGSWHGVAVNDRSRVTALHLSENGLTGQLPASLGDLAFLTDLRVDGNDGLAGPIPTSLSALGIQTLHYGGTMLCTVRDEGFRAWLNAVPTREGEFIACNEERSDLTKLYEAMGGEGWLNATNWGTSAPLAEWYGIAVGSTGRVIGIDLNRNGLSGEIPLEIQYFPHLRTLRLDYNRLEGEIPPEIGLLTELRRMDIDGNEFRGSIPPEIGNLVNLEELWMGGNQMSGPIPPEFGKLADLRELYLYGARFDGPIPEEFGNLAELRRLHIRETRVEGPIPESLGALTRVRILELDHNNLSGPIPAALGRMNDLRVLLLSNNEIDGPIPAALGQPDRLFAILLDNNMLSGALPPEFGDAGALERIWLQNNADLAGPLPESLMQLEDVYELLAHGTGLCVPQTQAFRTWIEESVLKYRIGPCGAEGRAEAYLTQAVQSREYPVPLVAGESALLRVFVMTEEETTEMIPPVRATFFVDGVETHVVDIPAGSAAIPTEVQVGEMELSANADIPAEVIQPGLEMVVEVDPDGTVDAALGVGKRIPAEGRAAVDVRVVPPLHLTLVPFVSTTDNDREAVTVVTNAVPDDEYFWLTGNLLPVGTVEITKHAPVTVDTNDIFAVLSDIRRIRQMEEGVGHWMALIPNPTGALVSRASPERPASRCWTRR